MTREEQIKELLEKPYFVIDFLPERVSENFSERFLEVEQYFLNGNELKNIAEKFVRIILKLSCYYKMEIYSEKWLDTISCKKFGALIKKIVNQKNGTLNILLTARDTMICVEGGALNLTIYNAPEEIQKLLSTLAISEGLFLWKGTE